MTFPSTDESEYTERARQLAERGATDREIAEDLGVSERTLYRCKHTVDGFAEQLKLGKDVAYDRVEQSLYRRATGYTFDGGNDWTHIRRRTPSETFETYFC